MAKVGMYSTVSCGELYSARRQSMGHAPCFLICAVWYMYMYHVQVYRRCTRGGVLRLEV